MCNYQKESFRHLFLSSSLGSNLRNAFDKYCLQRALIYHAEICEIRNVNTIRKICERIEANNFPSEHFLVFVSSSFSINLSARGIFGKKRAKYLAKTYNTLN